METIAPNFTPLYRQIKTLMLSELESTAWRPGEAIPTEQDLAQRYKVSLGTVRKAIDELANENLLIRRQGKGTFVASHEHPNKPFRFLKLKADTGEELIGRSQYEMLKLAKAGQDISKIFSVEVGKPILMIRRVLLLNEEPAVVDDIYLLADMFPELSIDRLRAHKKSIYSLYETEYNIIMVRADEYIKAISLDHDIATLMALPAHTPVLQVERVAYTYRNQAVEWRLGTYSTKHLSYFNQLG